MFFRYKLRRATSGLSYRPVPSTLLITIRRSIDIRMCHELDARNNYPRRRIGVILIGRRMLSEFERIMYHGHRLYILSYLLTRTSTCSSVRRPLHIDVAIIPKLFIHHMHSFRFSFFTYETKVNNLRLFVCLFVCGCVVPFTYTVKIPSVTREWRLEFK